ncbi:uncharacterized protein LOC128964439 [Oppia nitens]|uniref:uncharacterized protein LOC128964439 n=1 Tax=Oppia nitens TaxID=1686743 RepID=UPI0023DACDC1|nr:uncharacterized protein LOC128964439 [Oppia nitens]
MRLTLLLRSFRPEYVGPIPKFPGNAQTGKHRYVPKVTLGKKLSLFIQMKHEEQVIKYLSKPYVTEQQENAYLASIGRKRPQYWDDFLRRPIERPLKQYYAADYLQKIDYSRSFEIEE